MYMHTSRKQVVPNLLNIVSEQNMFRMKAIEKIEMYFFFAQYIFPLNLTGFLNNNMKENESSTLHAYFITCYKYFHRHQTVVWRYPSETCSLQHVLIRNDLWNKNDIS
jgi:hypothetical protein